jgi:hypothetical protein
MFYPIHGQRVVAISCHVMFSIYMPGLEAVTAKKHQVMAMTASQTGNASPGSRGTQRRCAARLTR